VAAGTVDWQLWAHDLRKHILNSGWAVAENIAYPILAFIATPVFVTNLGPDDFGLWVLFLTIVMFGAAINAGTAVAVTASVARAGSMLAKINSVLSGAIYIATFGGAVLFTATTLVFAAGAGALFPRMGDENRVILTGVSAALVGWIDQMDGVLQSALKGAERFSVAARWEITFKILQMVSCIGVAKLGGGALSLYLAYLLFAILRPLVKWRLVRHVWPGIKFMPMLSNAKPLFKLSAWGWLQALGGLLFTVSDRLMIGAVLGASSLAFYSIATQITSQIHALASSAFSIIAPAVSRISGKDAAATHLRSTLAKAIFMNIAFCASLAAILWMFRNEILSLWISNQTAVIVVDLIPPLAVAYMILGASNVPFYVLNGLGKTREIAVICIVGGSLALISGLLLVHLQGLKGMAISRNLYSICALLLFVPMIRALAKIGRQ
jgi:O-antigen/teichoic acid export membrane protein